MQCTISTRLRYDFEEPTFVLDFRNHQSVFAVMCAKPGEIVRLAVQSVSGPSTQVTRAVGRRSADGETFVVTVETPKGVQEHDWSWWILSLWNPTQKGKA